MDISARASKAKPEEKKKTPYLEFADFLRKYRLPVLICFGFILISVLAIVAITISTNSSVMASTARLETLDADFAAYSSEQDSAKKAGLEKSLLVSIDSLVKKGPRLYAAQKALIYKAKIEENKKDWAGAEKDWLAIAAAAPESYIAPVALQGAAVAAEELDATDRAIADYKVLIEKYGNASIGIPHAYFSLGRLAEQSTDYPNALVAYQKIVASWPDDDWTKLATDRIIFMKSHGFSK
jgi:hypothetical protein